MDIKYMLTYMYNNDTGIMCINSKWNLTHSLQNTPTDRWHHSKKGANPVFPLDVH